MSAINSSKKVVSPEQLHKRQAIWQIYLPAIVGAAVFVGLCVWVVLYTVGYVPAANLPDQQSPPAKVAVIWILLPSCLGGLLSLAVFGGSVYLLGRGIKGLPPLSHKVQRLVDHAAHMVHKAADASARPLIVVASQKAAWDRFTDFIAFWKHKD